MLTIVIGTSKGTLIPLVEAKVQYTFRTPLSRIYIVISRSLTAFGVKLSS